MKTTTKVGIGILVGLAVYLIYRMFEGYGKTVSSGSLTASNLQNSGAPEAPQGQAYFTPIVPSLDAAVPTVAPSTGPAVETRKGRGHF